MQPRIRRLNADYEKVITLFHSQHPYIRVVGTEGNPPERYTVKFSVRGLVPGDDGTVSPRMTHQAELVLPLDYPRRPPLCRMMTPIFHPNIDPQKICIGDHWSAGQSLASLIVRIAEMLCYQSYNTKSPLNARAAAWADQNTGQLPLQKIDLSNGL